MSEVWRSKNSSTTEEEFQNSLGVIKGKYQNLEYPTTLIEETFDKFQNSLPPKTDWQKEKLENPERNFTLRVPYTSNRVSKVCRKLKEKILSLTPEFNLHIVSRTITIKPLLLKQLRSETNKKDEINTVYMFSCPCEKAEYVGESERPLRVRVAEHGQASRESVIYNHIATCDSYKSGLEGKFGRFPTPSQKISSLLENFQILHRGLSNYGERITSEALEISLRKPNLNLQVIHKKICFS
jgi:hypothetical protein